MEREQSLEVYKESIQCARNADVDGIGFANIVQNAFLRNDLSQVLSAAQYTKNTNRSSKVLLVHSISGSLVLRQRQHVIGASTKDPVQDCLINEVVHWQRLGIDLDIIGNPAHLANISGRSYRTVIFLEPLAMLSSDIRAISKFLRGLASEIQVVHKKCHASYFIHQEGYDGTPLKFLSIDDENDPDIETGSTSTKRSSLLSSLMHWLIRRARSVRG